MEERPLPVTTRADVLRKLDEIPALPMAATAVLRLAEDPRTGIGEIMKAIEYDPGLTSDILRLANTAYFAGPRKIASLRDAGVLFGTQRIVELVLASSIFPITQKPLVGYDLPAGELTRHAMALAIGAECIAEMLDRPAPTHTFTSALLADIGKVILGTFLAVDAAPILSLALERNLSFEVAEREILGIDHAEAGAALLDQWNLPSGIIEVVRWHHNPEELTGDRYVVDLVNVAMHLTVGCGIGVGIDGLNYRPCQSSVDRLGLDQLQLEQATCDMLVAFRDIELQLPGHRDGADDGV